VAACIVVYKMHDAQLLMALCSLNVQQRDCVLCGSGEQQFSLCNVNSTLSVTVSTDVFLKF